MTSLIRALAATLALTFPAAAPAAAPNDLLYGFQWSLDQINAPEAWTSSTGSGQVIAVVDTGVELAHPDLAGKLVAGATFTGCANEPNGCGNGDWKSGNTKDAPSAHGTHVAGIAAAATGNGMGVAGAAPDAQIMPVKVLTSEGGSFAEVGAGIRWAADNGADVINLSLGALPGVQVLPIVGIVDEARGAIEYAASKGVVVVAAAGNELASICGEPSFADDVVCVVATDRNEARAWYSNFGVKPDLSVVAAPGGAGLAFCADDVVSSVPAGTEGVCGEDTPGYDLYAGTSMATPHVAGVAALLTAQGRTRAQVIDVLKTTARKPGTTARGVYDPVYGYGIVDAQAAVAS